MAQVLTSGHKCLHTSAKDGTRYSTSAHAQAQEILQVLLLRCKRWHRHSCLGARGDKEMVQVLMPGCLVAKDGTRAHAWGKRWYKHLCFAQDMALADPRE